MVNRASALLIALLGAASCSSLPAQWAEELEDQVRCDMSLDQVQELSEKKLEKIDSGVRGTHRVSDAPGTSEVWFVFVENKLKSVQVVWAHRVMEYAYFEQSTLCEDFEIPGVRSKLPDNNQ